ncbi:unnamed protein product [Coregonus sp. 'balchen']|nr:unnamed protein product [Coregonus sp. 'balchen']
MSDEETLESSSSDNESGQDDFEDPDFVAENVSDDDDDEQPGPSTAPTPTTSRRRPSQRGRGRKDQAKTRSRSPAQSAAQPEQSSEPWKTETDPDTAPQASRFMPRRPPGAQVDLHSGHTPKDLFLLYFAADTMRTICRNTNKQAARNQQKGSKYQTARWYRTLFLHFLDMGTTNAYILHCDISATQQVTPMTHKNFVAELVAQLCGVTQTGVPLQKSTSHVSVAIANVAEAKDKATAGRRVCQRCKQVDKKRFVTPWKCKACDLSCGAVPIAAMVYAQSTDSIKPSLLSLLSPSFTLPMTFNLSDRDNTSSATPFLCNRDALSSSSSSSSSGLRNTTQVSYELTPAEVAVLGLVFSLLWLVSILGNALVCVVIHRSRRSQSTTNYFVVSMACADLLLSLGCAPFILLQVTCGGWPLSAVACKAVRYLQHLCPGVQVYVLLSICVDRFYTIVYPLSFKVSREKAKRMILASWLLDAAFVSPCFFFYGSEAAAAADGGGHCDFFLPAGSWDGVAYGSAHLLLGFLVPGVLIVWFYRRVVRYIWRIGADGHTVRRTTNIVPRTKVKTIKMFLVLNVVFLLTWTPFYVVQLWHPSEAPSPGRQGALVFCCVVWVSFSATASKPLLYSAYNANFRRGMRETFCTSSMKCYRSNAYTVTASSRVAKKNYVGVVDIPVATKTTHTNDSVYDTFDREAKEKKLAWPISANPPNTFV